MSFNQPQFPSVGIETEFDLVTNFGVRQTVAYLRKAFPADTQDEIAPHTLESGTTGANNFATAMQTIISQFSKFQRQLKINDHIFPFGSLPNARTEQEQRQALQFLQIHNNEYYQHLLERDGSIVATNLNVNGLQFHVGQLGEANMEQMLKRYNVMRYLIPIFQGLSSSSPIRNSKFSGYASERVLAKKQLPKSGVPSYLRNEEHLKTLLDTLPDGVRKSLSPGYFWLRYPRTDLGTLELCSMDMIPDIKLTGALLDLYQRLCIKIDQTEYQNLPTDVFGNHEYLQDSDFINTNLESINLMSKTLQDTSIVLPIQDNIVFTKWLENIFKWIGDISSETAKYKCEDYLPNFLAQGTYSEQIIAELKNLEIITNHDSQIITPQMMPDVLNVYNELSQQNLFSKLN